MAYPFTLKFIPSGYIHPKTETGKTGTRYALADPTGYTSRIVGGVSSELYPIPHQTDIGRVKVYVVYSIKKNYSPESLPFLYAKSFNTESEREQWISEIMSDLSSGTFEHHNKSNLNLSGMAFFSEDRIDRSSGLFLEGGEIQSSSEYEIRKSAYTGAIYGAGIIITGNKQASNLVTWQMKTTDIAHGTEFDRTRGQQTEPKEEIIVSGTKPFEKPSRQRVFQSVKDIEEAYEFFPEASAEHQQQLGTFGLSQETQNIIDDWGTKKIIIPSWFVNNNMQWVLEGKISEQEFLAGYQNLVNTGIITYADEPTKLITTNFQVIIQNVTKYSTSLSNEDYKRLQDEMTLEPRVTLVFLSQTDFNPLTNFTDALLKIQGLLPDEVPPDDDEPEPDEVLPNANMVRQEIGRFQVVNKTLKGKITYIATDNFDKHFYYNFENNLGYILKCYVIATDSSGNVLLSKQNDLRFSETERDETITINDYVDTEENKITVEFYVTNTPTQDSFEDDFAFIRTITTPYFPKKPDTLFGALFGLIAIPTALTLLGTKT